MRVKRLLILALLAPLLLAFAQPQGQASVEILLDGSAHVVYQIRTSGSAVVNLSLIGLPDPNMVVLVQDERGEPLPYSVNEANGYMAIVALNASRVTVDYYTSTLTAKIRGRWVVNFTSPLPVTVKLPPNATISAFYTVPQNVSSEGRSLVLAYPPGPVVFAYVTPPPVVPQQPAQPPQPPPQRNYTAPQQLTPQPQAPAQAQGYPSLFYAAALAAVVVAVLAYVLTRRKPRDILEEFSEVDAEIIQVLKRAGGGMFQSELVSALGLPTTTVWRHVRKLASLGVVAVERRAGRNYIRLVKTA